MPGVVSETWVAHALVESAEKFGDTLQADEIGVGEWWDFTDWWGAEETYDIFEHAGRYAKDPERLEQRKILIDC